MLLVELGLELSCPSPGRGCRSGSGRLEVPECLGSLAGDLSDLRAVVAPAAGDFLSAARHVGSKDQAVFVAITAPFTEIEMKLDPVALGLAKGLRHRPQMGERLIDARIDPL